MSIYITYKSRRPKVTINGFDIPIGTVFTATGVGSKGAGLYLRIGSSAAPGIVSLTDPGNYWTAVNPSVKGYHPVDVDIVVTE